MVDQPEAFGRKTALMYAARYGHNDTVQFLIKAGANIQAESEFNKITPLGFALREGRTQTIDILLQAHAVICQNDLSDARGPCLTRMVEAIFLAQVGIDYAKIRAKQHCASSGNPSVYLKDKKFK